MLPDTRFHPHRIAGGLLLAVTVLWMAVLLWHIHVDDGETVAGQALWVVYPPSWDDGQRWRATVEAGGAPVGRAAGTVQVMPVQGDFPARAHAAGAWMVLRQPVLPDTLAACIAAFTVSAPG